MPGLTGFGSTRGAGGSEDATDNSWAARRVQAIAATNPEVASDPATLLNLALNSSIPDNQLAGTTNAITSDAALKQQMDNLRAMPAKDQVNWWNKIATPQQQQTLVRAGYNPRSDDLLALGALGLTDNQRSGIGKVTDPVSDAWSWSKRQVDAVTPDQLERPFDFVRKDVIGQGATYGLKGLNYPFQQVNRGINATLYQASKQDAGVGSFFSGWGNAWKVAGSDNNFRAQASQKASDLLDDDPLLYEAAAAQANGQDPVDFVMDKYGFDPQTPELQNAYTDLLSRIQRLKDPNAFGQAVKTLAFNRATWGQDVANLLGQNLHVPGLNNEKAFMYTSAAADLALAFKADPLLAFGKLRVMNSLKETGLVYRATNAGRDAVEGLNPLLKAIDTFRTDQGVVKKFQNVTSQWQKIKAGDAQAFNQFRVTEREFSRAIPAWVQWEAQGNKLESADNLFDWFKAAGEGGGLQPLVSGWFRKARYPDLVLPRYSAAGEALARTKLATLGRLDLTADKERIVSEVNRLGEGFAAQHLSPDQLKAVQDGSFVGLGNKILAPIANVSKKLTLQVRRSQGALLLDDSANFMPEIERWIDEGHTAGQSFIRRNQFLSDMLLAPNVEQRRVLASAYMQDMAEASGMLKTEEGRQFWSNFLDTNNQAYSFDGWDRIAGTDRRYAVLPHMQSSTAIAVPTYGELAQSVAQTHVMKLFTKLNADGVSTALSRFWKVPVLMRLGFIPRAAGEEYLSFMLARPEEARAYLRASIAAAPEGAIFLPAKPFLLPLRGVARAVGKISEPTGRTIDNAADIFGRMISTPIAGPVRWWAAKGADTRIVDALKGWQHYDELTAQGVKGDDMLRALEDLGHDPYMVRSMAEGFTDVSARHHGLSALLVNEGDETPDAVRIFGPRGQEIGGNWVADRSRYVAYPNVNAPGDEAKAAATAAGVDLTEQTADFFPAMYTMRTEELWREGAVRNGLEELSRRYVGPRVDREIAQAWGQTGEGQRAFDEFRAAWGRLDEPVQAQIKAVFRVDRVDPVAAEQVAKRLQSNPDAARVVAALRHEGVSANTIEAAVGDLRDGHLIFDHARANDMFRARIASELQDPANRDAVEQMVRAFQDSRGRHIAVPVADGQTPLYSIVADPQTNRDLAQAMTEAGGRKPNPGGWPIVSGSRDLPAFDQHWTDFHDARDMDFVDLVGGYVDGGATSVPVSAWATHDHRRAEAMRQMLEDQYHLPDRLAVGHVNVETAAAKEGIGTPIAPDVVHRVEGGAANDLYRLGPGSLPLVEPLTEGAVVDWAKAVDDTTVANVIRLAESDPEAFDRLMAAARTDFHTNHVTWVQGNGYRNPAAMSREAFLADPEHALLDKAGQALNRHFGREWDPASYRGVPYDSGIAAAAYREHDDYLQSLADGLRKVGKGDLADEALGLRRRVLGEDRPSVTVVDGKLVAPDLPDYGALIEDVAGKAEDLHGQWLTAALGDKADAARTDPAALWDDIAGGGAPSVERLVGSLPAAEQPLADALLGQLARYKGDARSSALQRSVLDPLDWAKGGDAPPWARNFADELRLVHNGDIAGTLENTLARRATLPTPGVMPGDLYDDWANIVANHVDKLLFTRDGELLHAVTQPALRGHIGADTLARIDARDLPAAVLGPSLAVRPTEALSFGQKFDNVTSKVFDHIGGAIDQMSRKPLYISNYVRESAVNPYLMDALIDKGWKAEAAGVVDDLDQTGKAWRMLAQVDVRATRARARQSVFEDAVGKLADQLHGEGKLDEIKPTLDRLLELSPQERVTLGRHFDNVQNARKVTADAAATRAVVASVPFIDDHNIRSQYASYMKNLQPFFFAEEQFYKRWIRTLAMRPEAIQRGQQYMMGLRHAGIVHQDENGNWVFTYPGSAEGLQAVTKALGLVGVNANMPVDMALTGNVRRTLPGIGQFGAPGFSPLVTVPVGGLAMVLPEAAGFDLLKQKLGGPWANQGLVDQVMPTTYKRLWAAATHDPEKDPQMASAMFQAVQYLAATGQMPDGSDPAETQVFLDRARNWARTQMVWRAAFGFVGPASPSNALGDDGLNEEARKLIGSLGMEDGMAELVRRHPDYTAFDLTAQGVAQTEVLSNAPLPALKSTTDWLDGNGSLLQQYPNAGLFLMPPPDADNKFDIEAYYHQLSTGYRVRRGLDDTWQEMIFRRDAPRYFDTNQQLDQAYVAAQTPAARQTVEALKKAFGDEYRSTHPVFAQKLAASESEEQRNQTISELGRMLADPSKLPATDTTRKVNVAWQTYQNLQDALSVLSRDGSKLASDKRTAVRNATLQWGDAYAQRNPEVAALWQRVLRTAVASGSVKSQVFADQLAGG